MVINIGDTFRIDMTEAYEVFQFVIKCKYPNKTFVVDKFSKSSRTIYYHDHRTTSKCKCTLCVISPYKSINADYCIITETNLQKERKIKLRQI